MGYIYKIENNLNGKVYIGQSVFPIEKRFKEHCRDSKNPNKNKIPFYYALNKYGIENFTLSLIEECPNEELNDKEIFWIKYYHSYIHDKESCGYNATKGGSSRFLYDYKNIVDDYLITQSKTQTAKNFNCNIETVDRALQTFEINTIKNSCGRKIYCKNEFEELVFPSIRQAAIFIAQKNNKNFETVRKKINFILLHKPNQKGYEYNWFFI